MSLIRSLGTLAAAALLAGTAAAAPVTWSLSGATLDDGSTASGSFTYDAATATYSNWSIHFTAGAQRPAIDYGASAAVNPLSSPLNLVLTLGNVSDYMNLAFASALTDAGGTIALALGQSYDFTTKSWECGNCNNVRNFTGGAVTSTVPEPATLLLVGTLLAGLAAGRRRA
ncbi:MAG: PEP-CTERM sorting domain-containing protein [Burkholderiales bacterium]|nr:PEP-CTERM sorting domain-containing protein [Burkholderiales bacterium]